jgi:hypothetical protein
LTKAVVVDVRVLVDVDGILLFVITGYESEQIYRVLPGANGRGTLQKEFIIGEWLFVDSRGFCLGSPDRRAEGAGKPTIVLNQVLEQLGRGHPSFQRKMTNDAL